jgi:hypothetical protein
VVEVFHLPRFDQFYFSLPSPGISEKTYFNTRRDERSDGFVFTEPVPPFTEINLKADEELASASKNCQKIGTTIELPADANCQFS